MTNLIWFNSGHKPLHWDSSIHLLLSVDAYETFSDNISNPSFINKMLGISWYYPPMVYFASVPFYYLFGINEITGFIEINAFLILLLITVYLTGSKLYCKSAGIFGAFCISMYPIVIEYSRDYMLDLPLAGLVALSVFLLIKTENFTDSFYCVLTGMALGCGMLIKWTFIFFLIVPLVFFFINGIKIKGQKLRVILNLFLTTAACFILCLPWYIKNLIMILSTRSGEMGRTDLTLLQSIFYYIKIIPEQVSFFIAILFITGIVLFVVRKKITINYFLLSWFIGSYIILTLVKIKAPRFSISLLIPLTLLVSGIIFSDALKSEKRKIFIYVFVITAIIQYLVISFTGLKVNFSLPLLDTPVLADLTPVKSENYNLQVLNLIEDDMIKDKKQVSVLRVIPNIPNFNNSTLKYYAKIKNYPVNILGLSGFPLFTDYAAVKTGNSVIGNSDNKRTALTSELLSDTSQFSEIFKEFGKIEMDDNSKLILLKPQYTAEQTISTDSLKQKIFFSSENFLKKYFRPKDNYKFEIVFDDTAAALSGQVKLLKIYSAETEFGDFSFKETGLKINNFEIDMKNFNYAMVTLMKYNKLDILSMNGIEINSLEINSADLKDYIEKSTGGKVQILNISFENNLIHIEGHSNQLNTDFLLEINLSQTEDSNLVFMIEKCRIFNISVPVFLLNFMLGNYNPLIKGIEFIKDFKLNKLEIKNNKLIIKKDI